MSRSARLNPVHRIAEDAERTVARKLAQAEHRVSECEKKLQDLKRYHEEYARGFNQRVAGGIGALELRDYQVFLARLNEAVKQQSAVVQRAEAECESVRSEWRLAARRTKAVSHVREQWLADERRDLERREQSETDDRAQRVTRGDVTL
jgi:flagellar FliJ protein